MFELQSIMDLLKAEPGHGLIQSIILFGIWFQAKGVKQEIANLATSLNQIKLDTEHKFQQHDTRIIKLEEAGETK